MPRKTLIIILAILVVGVGAVIYLNQSADKKSANQSAYSLPSFNQDGIDNIQIKTAQETLELKKSSSGWEVNGKSADESKINSLWEAFSDVKVSGPVSTSDQYYDRFQVDEAGGVTLIFKSGTEEVLNLIIGKAGTRAGTTYFKPANEKNVYVAERNWHAVVFKKVDDWRDKTVWSFADDEVAKVTAKTGGKVYEASKKDGKWQITYRGKIKEAPNLGSSLKTLKAISFITEEKEMPDSITFYGSDDQELGSFSVGKDEGGYYLQKSDGEDIYKVSAYTFEKVWLPSIFDKEE